MTSLTVTWSPDKVLRHYNSENTEKKKNNNNNENDNNNSDVDVDADADAETFIFQGEVIQIYK